MYRRKTQARRAPARRAARRKAPVRRAAPVARASFRRPPTMRRAYRRRATRGYPVRRVMRNKAMTAHTTRRGDIVIEKSEYIADLIPSIDGSFKSQVYNINPGLTSVFPFVSGIAQQYEEYDPVYMQIIFKTTSGNSLNSVNAALGTVGITPVYNTFTNTATLNSKVICESFDGATSGPPSKSQVLKLQTKNSRNPLDTYFTRAGPVPANQTSSMTDMANIIVWSSGLQTNVASSLGEIWVRYKFVFKSPKPGTLLTVSPFVHARCTGTLSTSSYFGSARTFTAPSNFIPVFTGTQVTFPSDLPLGNYLLNYTVYGVGAGTPAGPSVVYTSGCQAYNLFLTGTQTARPSSTAAAADYMTTMVSFTVTAASAVLSFNSGTFPGTASACDFIVTKIPDGVA